MFFDRSHCSVIRVDPSELCDVISVTPEIVDRRRSSGVATLCAITSGLAPARLAETLIVGKSTWGRGATASEKNPAIPASATPIVSRTVPTGRLIKGADRFKLRLPDRPGRRHARP